MLHAKNSSLPLCNKRCQNKSCSRNCATSFKPWARASFQRPNIGRASSAPSTSRSIRKWPWCCGSFSRMWTTTSAWPPSMCFPSLAKNLAKPSSMPLWRPRIAPASAGELPRSWPNASGLSKAFGPPLSNTFPTDST